ncbi:hypothetical protein BDF22DRAFT_658249 [Syncephalis plumigaleata]|nr:hypothetical protein BDF22DRAFT_658249 [Syncephalis plumigaleata]
MLVIQASLHSLLVLTSLFITPTTAYLNATPISHFILVRHRYVSPCIKDNNNNTMKLSVIIAITFAVVAIASMSVAEAKPIEKYEDKTRDDQIYRSHLYAGYLQNETTIHQSEAEYRSLENTMNKTPEIEARMKELQKKIEDCKKANEEIKRILGLP